MEWIKMEQQLPPDDVGVLVTDGNLVTAARLEYREGIPCWWDAHGFSGYEWEFDFPERFPHNTITHWMYLPDAPKDE